MIAVIFELEPKSGQTDSYFSIAGTLKPLVDKIDGFISIERFESVTGAIPKYRTLCLELYPHETGCVKNSLDSK